MIWAVLATSNSASTTGGALMTQARAMSSMVLLTTFMIACAGDDTRVTADGSTVSAEVKPASRDLQRVKHVIVVMMENHSFDNYLGVLPYAPGSPYHAATSSAGCQADDHACVDGLRCQVDGSGALQCSNANLDDDGSTVVAFHNSNRCVQPDLEHGWPGTHREVNFAAPNATRRQQPMDGFVRVNNEIQPSNDDQTMGYYNQNELPFYYDLAQHFAISDRFFSSMLGPTFPNRAYFAAGTSFGHLTTSDQIPPLDGYKPINGTIFDLLDRNHVSWTDYYTDIPQGASFRPFGSTVIDPNFLPVAVFLAKAAGVPGAGDLPSVSFVDPGFGPISNATASDEHPPTDIQRGQAFASAVINAVRNGPFWQDSVIFITYDEHGGFYDHVAPPRAVAPDAIQPGQCADLSNPPASLEPGGGAECSDNLHGDPETSVVVATELCPALAADPTGTYPDGCAKFDQLGVRVPFIAVSPFSRPRYVSHRTADLTSILAFIETRFMPHQHLTERDHLADNLLDLFDFTNAPSLATQVQLAAPPLVDCTPPD